MYQCILNDILIGYIKLKNKFKHVADKTGWYHEKVSKVPVTICKLLQTGFTDSSSVN